MLAVFEAADPHLLASGAVGAGRVNKARPVYLGFFSLRRT